MAKPTKAQKAALRRSKERAAKRTKLPTPLDTWAIKLHEGAQAMKRAGFDEPTIMGWLVEQSLPEWFVSNPDHSPFEDEEEDDED